MSIEKYLLESFQDTQIEINERETSNLKSLSNNTFAAKVNIYARVTAQSVDDISLLLKLANDHGFCVQPISSGNNWGYGSINHVADKRPLVVLDLSRLNKITPIDKDLGLLSVEPGVTQGQLSEYFKQNDWPYLVPVTGAGPNCSILSNALERGYGITPYTDHFAAITSMKVILPSPEFEYCEMNSAMSEIDSSDTKIADKTFKWGVGPYLDGIFTQSNYGIVTSASLRLFKRPEHFSSFYIRCFDAEKFPQCVAFIKDTLQRFEGIVGSINLMDQRRMLSMSVEHPYRGQPLTIMSEDEAASLAKKNGLPQWTIVGTLYGEKAVINAAKGLIKTRAKSLGHVLYTDSWIFAVLNKLLKVFPEKSFQGLRVNLHKLSQASEIMLGTPNYVALPLSYWRNPNITPQQTNQLDPAKDNCGLLWYAPVIHMNADSMKKFVTHVRNTMKEFKIEPLITFTNLRHDCIDATLPIIFDSTNQDEVAAAKQCLQALVSNGLKQGFVPYRVNVEQQESLFDASTPFWKTVNVIKQSLDPNNILSPNRYRKF